MIRKKLLGTDDLAEKVVEHIMDRLAGTDQQQVTQVSDESVHQGCGGKLVPHYPDNPQSVLIRCNRCGLVGYPDVEKNP